MPRYPRLTRAGHLVIGAGVVVSLIGIRIANPTVMGGGLLILALGTYITVFASLGGL